MDMGRIQIAVINLLGTVYMESMQSPFDALDELLKTPELPKLCVVDFHAEATGEKRAFGYWADGRATAVFGTHTHVQTADECILPCGTGYITDVGMTGPIESVLGVKPELIIRKLRPKCPSVLKMRPVPAGWTVFYSPPRKKPACDRGGTAFFALGRRRINPAPEF